MRSAAAPAAINPAALPLAFARALERLGPFETTPRLAVGVSGGADSTALILLAADWARAHGGDVLALIVDHGLRPEAAAEARLTHARLAARSIPARVLTLTGLAHGPALAKRARDARLACLIEATRAAGLVHLLLGHHAADQAETQLMRAHAGSGLAGLAGMTALRELTDLRVLRPLLHIEPDCLRDWLRTHFVPWVEDPSNADPSAGRTAIRAQLARTGRPAEQGADRVSRAQQEAASADELARRARISPLGFAVISPGPISLAALATLWHALSGRAYPPPAEALRRCATCPAPMTLAGLRLLPAGKLGPGWLLVREQVPPPVQARLGARWDRFVLHAGSIGDGAVIGALGAAAPRTLPHVIRRVLPGLLRDGLSVPGAEFRLMPQVPACGGGFV